MFSSWKDYFTFNKKERNGILILCFVLFLLLIFYQFTHLFVSETTTDFSEFEKAISDLDYLEEKEIASKEAALFYFNPNTLDDKGWLTLGLSEAKLQVLRNYQKSGGYFKNNEDLQRCYAFGDAFYNSIKDYVQIPKLDQPKDLEIAKDVKKQADHCFTDKKTRSAGKKVCRNYFTIQKSGAIGKTVCRNYFTDQKKRSARKKASRNYL